jgi:hypothetical protein
MLVPRKEIMKLKAALVKAGKLKASEAGRGRPSAQMKEWGQELVDEGWSIEGFSPTGTPATVKPEKVTEKPKPAGKPAEIEVPPKSKGILDIGDPIRPTDQWEAYVTIDGKQVPPPIGPKQVCENCGNSLPYCYDKTPVVRVDHETLGVVNFRLI